MYIMVSSFILLNNSTKLTCIYNANFYSEIQHEYPTFYYMSIILEECNYLHAYLIIILQFLSKKMFPCNYNNLFPSTTSPSYSIYLKAYR